MTGHVPTHKFCKKCRAIKPATREHFHKNGNYPDGWYSQCKMCRNGKKYPIPNLSTLADRFRPVM